ncbi:MAG TPA: 3-hydroxyanthranilate 3,4-dioxygenase [Bacteroidia bacterium]|nr:3-hydroxyanthranilate 3,4-dioxygenase [Bacteroidia bacterium]
MPVARPFNIKKWIDENRHLLKPPVGNQQVFKASEDYIVMVVGGPNARKDYHFEDGEELFYQLEGNITVKIQEDGKPVDVHVKEGEMFLLPPHIYHCPQRPANTIGLVVERVRKEPERDSCVWFCEKCNNKMHEEVFALKDIVNQLPAILNKFYSTPELHTCKKCGTVMMPPAKPN